METGRKSCIPRTPLNRGMTNRISFASAQPSSRMAEPRYSMAGFRMSTARASLATGSMSGRPSTLAPVGENVRRILPIPRPIQKDFRSLSDKARQLEMVAHVMEFLRNRDVGFHFSEKWLRTISKADFKTLVEYMLRQLDETFTINKLEEDVPRIFFALGYPYNNLKPSTMVTIGAQHSWNHVITALDWLVDVVECDDNMDEESLGKDSLAYSYFTSCYKKVMNATNPDQVEFAEELKVFKQLLNGDEDIETQIEDHCFQRIENEKALQAIKEDVEKEQQCMRETEICVRDFEADVEAMKKFIRSLKCTSAQMDQNLEYSEIEMQKLREALTEIEQECASKEVLIANQKLSGEEARALQIKRNSLRENLMGMRREIGDAEMKQFNLQPQVFRMIHQIRGEYRTILTGVQELLPSDKLEQFDFAKLEFDEVWRAFTTCDSSENELNKLIEYTKAKQNKSIEKYRQEKRQLEANAEEAEREIREVENNMARASKKEKLATEQIAREVEDSSKAMEQIQYELDMVQTKRGTATNEAHLLNTRCKELRDRLAEKERQYIYHKNELEKSYNNIVVVVCDKIVLLTSKMEEIAADKQMWKEMAEKILKRRKVK